MTILFRWPDDVINRNDFSPAVLVNESFPRLFPNRLNQLQDRQEFFRIAARSMRQIVFDDLRARDAEKRGGDRVRTELDEKIALPEAPDIKSLNQAQRRLRQKDNELTDLVDAYFFAGMTFGALAEIEKTSVRTIRRRWATARLLLLCMLGQ